MRKCALLFCCVLLCYGCDKHDPILPGVRTAIFDNGTAQNILNQDVPSLSDLEPKHDVSECPYTIDNTNTVRDVDRNKIFVGFPAPNSMDIETHPVCDGRYVYAGLNTGNVVKIAPSNRRVIWMADVYSESNMIGGATTVDIVAPLVIDGSYIYVGGMGDAFCKINIANGNKKWCARIGTRHPFITFEHVLYVVGLDDALYALRASDGAIYWRSEIQKSSEPIYQSGIIMVGKQRFDAIRGQELK